MLDEVDTLCNDYSALNKKIAEKEMVCKELQESSEKLNNALLYQMLKSQEQSNKENRELKFTSLVCSYTALILAFSALGLNIWKDVFPTWTLAIFYAVIIILIVGGLLTIHCAYRSKITE